MSCILVNYEGMTGSVWLQDDTLTHLYTLIVKPDNTFEVKIDNKKEESGTLEADWDFLAPKMIKVLFYVDVLFTDYMLTINNCIIFKFCLRLLLSCVCI